MEKKRGIKHFRDLDVYKKAFASAMKIMEKNAEKFCF